MRFKALLFIGSVLILLSSCNASKRAQRHVRKAIALDPTISVVDTIRDTIYGERVDTILSLPLQQPQIIQGERGSVRLTYNGMDIDGSPLVSVVAQVDTQFIEVPVERIKYVTKPDTFWGEVKKIILWVVLGLAAIVIFKVIIENLMK